MALNRRKWHRYSEIDKEILEPKEELHLWGPKIGSHTAYLEKDKWITQTGKFINEAEISHFYHLDA